MTQRIEDDWLINWLGFAGYWLVNLISESTPYPDDLGSGPRRLSAINHKSIRSINYGSNNISVGSW